MNSDGRAAENAATVSFNRTKVRARKATPDRDNAKHEMKQN